MSEEIFKKLFSIDVNKYVEMKGRFKYISWANAWAEVKKIYPNAKYKIKKFGEDEKPYLYDQNTGYMVFTEVTIEKMTYEMWLPVMDYNNKIIMKATMSDINKAIMRCLVKNLAIFGFGLYIYAGEDIPEIIDIDNYLNKYGEKKSVIVQKILSKFKVNNFSELNNYQISGIIRCLDKKGNFLNRPQK